MNIDYYYDCDLMALRLRTPPHKSLRDMYLPEPLKGPYMKYVHNICFLRLNTDRRGCNVMKRDEME